MLKDFSGADAVYIACGNTDLRRGIGGLVGMVQQQFLLHPFSDTLFLFCGRQRDRVTALYWGATDLTSCTSDWKKVCSNGPAVMRRCGK